MPNPDGSLTEEEMVAAWLASLGVAPPAAQIAEPTPTDTYTPPADSGYSYAPEPEPAPPPPPPSLSTDPGWLGLEAELGQRSQVLSAEAQRRRGNVQAESARLLAELGPRGEQERVGIEGGMEARGLFGGGQMQEKIARQRANEASRSNSINSGMAQQLSDIEGQLALQQAALEQERAKNRADFLGRGYVA